MGTYQSKFTGEEIDGLLEEVRNGGAGGGASETVLWEGTESTVGTTLTLSDSIENYDYIYIETGSVNASNALRLVPPTLLKVSSIVSNGYTETIFYAAGVMANHTGMYTQACLYFTGAKSLKFGAKFEDGTNAKNTCVRKVVGLKLGGGSSSSGTKRNVLWEGTESTVGNTITLSDSIENYDELYVETGYFISSGAKRVAPPTMIEVESIIKNGYGSTVKYFGNHISNGNSMWSQANFNILSSTEIKYPEKYEDGTNATKTSIFKVIGIKY